MSATLTKEEALLEQASNLLEEILGSYSAEVQKEWDRAEGEAGQTLYTLRLADWSGAKTAVFTLDELQRPGHLGMRLRFLWGALLRIRSDRLLQGLRETGE